MKRSFLFIFIGFVFCFISCDEPDDPVMPYDDSMPILMGKTINSIDIFWTEASLSNFQYYEVFYREYYTAEPKKYITLNGKKQIYATITGLMPNIEYKIFVVTADKSGNRYASKELSVKTYTDMPSSILGFRVETENNSFIRFVWTPYSDSYAVPFSRYEMYMDTVNNFICGDSNRIITKDNYFAAQADFNISDLEWGKNYYFKLRTYNTLEKYSESGTISFSRM
jgi:hypothetical protein